MFDSTIELRDAVAELKEEIDIAVPIPNSSYVQWANAVEQLLYREYICEQGELVVIHDAVRGSVDLEELTPKGEAPIRFEDVLTVFSGGTQLIKTTLAGGQVFDECYFKRNGLLEYKSVPGADIIKIIYYVKPRLKTVDGGDIIGSGNIMLPIEWVDVLKARLRAEAYKIANEDAIAAKWANDYNVLLENFKAWLEQKKPVFGM